MRHIEKKGIKIARCATAEHLKMKVVVKADTATLYYIWIIP